MNEIEIWKDVKDYEGIYQISSTGKIRNLKTKKELSLNKSNAGYLRTVISKKDSKPKHVLIHRLVLETFAPCANMNNLQVNHIDENKLNNCLSNLEWCTHEYNNNFGTKKRECH